MVQVIVTLLDSRREAIDIREKKSTVRNPVTTRDSVDEMVLNVEKSAGDAR